MSKKYLISLNIFLLLFILLIIFMYDPKILDTKLMIIILGIVIFVIFKKIIDRLDYFYQKKYDKEQVSKIKIYFNTEIKRVILKKVEDSFDLLDDKIGIQILKFITINKIDSKEISFRVFCEGFIEEEDIVIVLIYKECKEKIRISLINYSMFYKYFEFM